MISDLRTRAISAREWPSGLVSAAAEQGVLAVLAPEYDSEPIVRSAQRLASSLNAPWIVLYVERTQRLHDANQSVVAKTLALARELGAEVITTADENVVAAVLRVSGQRNVTHIVLGKAAAGTGARCVWRDSLVPKLVRQSGATEIHVVSAGDAVRQVPAGTVQRTLRSPVEYFEAAAVIGVVALAAFLFTPLVGAHATALIFLLTVVVLAFFVERGPTLMAATMSALLWDYFFLPPIYQFRITHFEDAMLFAMYFVVALVLGQLTTRIRTQQEAERERETRATLLYLLTRDLNESLTLDQMTKRIVQQLGSFFGGRVGIFLPASGDGLTSCPGNTLQPGQGEQDIPLWVLTHRQRAGKFTSNSAGAKALYIPLLTSSAAVGVLGLEVEQPFGLSIHQESLVEALSKEIAMALDRRRLQGISQEAKLLAESERLSKTLLDSMSHEIRTPLAAINSATGNLAELREDDAKTRQAMIAELQEATARLNRLVGNVLEASRLESGTVKPRFNECDTKELINVTLVEMEKELSTHKMSVTIEPGLPMIPMDFVLTQQALINLLSNSALHSPAGTLIEVGAKLDGDELVLSVADRGPGIPPDSLARIFEKFYRVPNSKTGGTGLGLSLVKGFIEAQGGRVTVASRAGDGVRFELRLPRLNPILNGADANV
ncbi:MAG TPA: ATP-binding protein [Candidatus Limnocylindrales bacterium]|nr:ATP-binding protein [Candidatus Limnocylindrales bacterium]